MHLRLVAVAALVACLAAPTAGARLSLASSLSNLLARDGIPESRTGALVVDLGTGSSVIARNAGKSFRPASTEKLTVAVAALDELGPGLRLATAVLGRGDRDGSRWEGDLVLKGFGDPRLDAADLATLARGIRAQGIRRVTGRVVGDESFFDRKRTAPGWKASYYKDESPPLGALVVDEARLDGRIADEPALAAAIAFRRALRAAGIRVDGKAGLGRAGSGATELARVTSPPVRRLVAAMNTESDNFVAEMLLKGLGARELGEGTTAAGARVVLRALAERGVPLAGVRIVDGSGLSRLDRLTPQAIAALLVSARKDARISRPLVRSLAVAGVSGTLEDRMETGAARGRVRAKTGTTDRTSALAGYARARYVFVLIMSGNPVPVAEARRSQDRFAGRLAAE